VGKKQMSLRFSARVCG